MVYNKEPHLYIFIGHFGSGKTEVSVNFALDLKKQKPDAKVALVDMDIINPFFRSADAKDELEKAGIKVETMLYANSNVDAPALTGRMGYLIDDLTTDVILDIGGDDLGARACGYYAEHIFKRPHTIFFVMNPFRPFTSTPELTLKIFREVEEACRVKIDSIVDNTNMLQLTTVRDLEEGREAVSSFADSVGLPVGMHCVMPRENAEIAKYAKEAYPEDKLLLMDEHVTLVFGRD